MSTSGSIREVALDGRNFAVAADADAERKLGGYTNEVQANGNRTARVVQTAVPWVLSGLTLSIDDDRGDQEFLQDLQDSGRVVPMSVTLASNATYSGEGTITEDIAFSTQNGTAGVSLSGGGKLEKQ